MGKKLKTHTIDCEPKWVDLMPLFCDWLEQGINQEFVRKELTKIATIADIVRQAQKKAKEVGEKEVTLIFVVE